MKVINANTAREKPKIDDARYDVFPVETREFFKSIGKHLEENGLFKSYAISSRGILTKHNGKRSAKPIFTPFRVSGMTRSKKTQNWSRCVEVLDPLGCIVECRIPNGILDSKPREALALMSQKGFRLYDDDSFYTIISWLRKWTVPIEGMMIEVDETGWNEDFSTFLLSTGEALSKEGTNSQYRLGVKLNAKSKGTLDQWRSSVSHFAIGNPNMIFSIALAFSSALLPFTPLRSIIFHLFGRSSQGKTCTLEAALSVWPKIDDKAKTWDTTKNGVEGEIAMQNHIMFGLDDLPKDASPELGNIIYKVAHDIGKGRADKTGGAVTGRRWTTATLSTGENSMVETLRGLKKTATGGQSVRMIDIPAEGKHGVFDNLHSYSTGKEFVLELERVSSLAYGVAGKEFVMHLLGEDVEELKAAIQHDLSEADQKLQLDLAPPGEKIENNEVLRVIRFFALVSVAGELATKAGITGWPRESSYDSVKTVAQRWLQYRGIRPFEETRAIERIKGYIEAKQAEILPLSKKKSSAVSRFGYHDAEFYFLVPAALAKIHDDAMKANGGMENINLKTVLQDIKKAGFLIPGGEKNSDQVKENFGDGRQRYYRIRKAIFDA